MKLQDQIAKRQPRAAGGGASTIRHSHAAPNPMSPGFARFVQAQNEIGASESIDDLLAAYLFHRIRHQVEEDGYFAGMLDRAAIDKAKELGVMPIRTYGMSDDAYDDRVLKELTQSGRFNRYYIVEDRQLISPIQGYGDPLEAMRVLREMRSGEQIDLFGDGPRVMSAKALVRRYIGIEED